MSILHRSNKASPQQDVEYLLRHPELVPLYGMPYSGIFGSLVWIPKQVRHDNLLYDASVGVLNPIGNEKKIVNCYYTFSYPIKIKLKYKDCLSTKSKL